MAADAVAPRLHLGYYYIGRRLLRVLCTCYSHLSFHNMAFNTSGIISGAHITFSLDGGIVVGYHRYLVVLSRIHLVFLGHTPAASLVEHTLQLEYLMILNLWCYHLELFAHSIL
jgi:hypothetical protein